MDQSQCSADLSLSEDELIAEGRHFLCASKMRPKSGSFRFHDLRHTGAVLAAATGATLAEWMQRLGHTTAGAAMRYQYAAPDRDAQIAEALSRIAAGA